MRLLLQKVSVCERSAVRLDMYLRKSPLILCVPQILAKQKEI